MDICGSGRTYIQWAAEVEREQLGLKGQRQKIWEAEENVTEWQFWEKVPMAGSQWKRNAETKHVGFMCKERDSEGGQKRRTATVREDQPGPKQCNLRREIDVGTW